MAINPLQLEFVFQFETKYNIKTTLYNDFINIRLYTQLNHVQFNLTLTTATHKTLNQCWFNFGPKLYQSWDNVADVVPAFGQRWANMPC